jgi:hypothetical protein
MSSGRDIHFQRGDAYISPQYHIFPISLPFEQRQILSYTSTDLTKSLTFRFEFVSNVLFEFPVAQLPMGYIGLTPSPHVYVNPLIQLMFWLPRLRNRIIQSQSLLAQVLTALNEHAFPISSDFIQISFDYENIADFIPKFIDNFLPSIGKDLRVLLKLENGDDSEAFYLSALDQQLLSEKRIEIVTAPDFLFVEPKGQILPTFQLGKFNYGLTGVVMRLLENAIALMKPREADRWVRFADTIVDEVPQDFADSLSPVMAMYARSVDELDPESRAPLHKVVVGDSEITISIILPMACAAAIRNGILVPVVVDPFNIGVSSGSTFSEVYQKVSLLLQTAARPFNHWRFEDGRITSKPPCSDDVIVDTLPPLIAQFSYPGQSLDTDFFVFVALFQPFGPPPSLQLLFTLSTTHGSTFLDIGDFARAYLNRPDFGFDFFLGVDKHQASLVRDPIRWVRDLPAGSVIVLSAREPGLESVLPPSCLPPSQDFLIAMAGLDFPAYLELRRCSRSIVVHHRGVHHTATFPPSVELPLFCQFVYQLLDVRVFPPMDASAFYGPHATLPMIFPPAGGDASVLNGLECIDVYVFPRMSPRSLRRAVRLEVKVDRPSVRRVFVAFRGKTHRQRASRQNPTAKMAVAGRSLSRGAVGAGRT